MFDGLTFIWSAALVLGIQPVRAGARSGGGDPRGDEPSEGFMAEVTAGYRAILGSATCGSSSVSTAPRQWSAGASLVFDGGDRARPARARRSGVGYLNAMLGIGGLIGGFVALVLVQRGRLARDFGIGVFFWAAPLLLVAAWPTVPLPSRS